MQRLVSRATVSRRAFSVSALMRSNGSGGEGSTAQSKTFSQREKSAEEQYIMQQEREKYEAAKKLLQASKEKLMKEHGLTEAELENVQQKK